MRGLLCLLLCSLVTVCFNSPARAQDLSKREFKIFQFPANAIPRIDGQTDDWAMVTDEYLIGTDQMGTDNPSRPRAQPDPASLDIKVRVGWVKGTSQLYFLYEAFDNYWDFAGPGMHNDTFEIALDADRSGGPFIDRFHPAAAPQSDNRSVIPADAPEPAGGFLPKREAWFTFHGRHAQNYHIFTPAQDKDWCMAWGPQAAWIKELPYSNIVCKYDFKPGESGRLTAEFWVTCFDHAPGEGPEQAIQSTLTDNKIIGLAWAVLDYDTPTGGSRFWNLSTQHNMFGQASELCAFRLMPLDAKLRKPIEANWSFKVVDLDRRVVAFQDETWGRATSWQWDFGDGTTSTEQHPIHTYAQTGQYVVVLSVEGPEGKSKRSKVWDVTLR